MRMPAGAASTLLIMSGLIVWASSFVVLYAGLSLGCQYGWSQGLIRTTLLALWIAHLAVLAWMTLRAVAACRRHRAGDAAYAFAWRATATVNVFALAGTVWTGLPVLAVTPCA